MKKRAVPIALLLLLGVICFKAFQPNTGKQGSSQSESEHQAGHSTNISSARQGRDPSKDEWTHNKKTEAPVAFGSMVNAEIQEGEVLVMGGYRTPDGYHNFTALSPSLVSIDGEDKINLSGIIFSVGPDLTRELGLQTLTTQYPSADQHAETWSQEDLKSMCRAMSKKKKLRYMRLPPMTPAIGQTVELGTPSNRYLKTTVNTTDNGGFSIQHSMKHKIAEE